MKTCPVCHEHVYDDSGVCPRCLFDVRSLYTTDEVNSYRMDYWETLLDFDICIEETALLRKADNIHRCERLIIPYGVEKIGKRAFTLCDGVDTVIIPNTVRLLDAEAFYKSSVNNIVFENDSKLIYIGTNCFSQSKIKEFLLPKSVWAISHRAFSDCDITSFKCEKGVHIRAFGEEVFGNCHFLEEAELPYGLKSLKSGLFDNCVELSYISIPDTVQRIEHCFDCCENLFLLPDKLPDSVEIIEDFNSDYFWTDELEEDSIFPLNLKRIGACAFLGCDYFRSVFFHSKLEAIESAAFDGCSKLQLAIIPKHAKVNANAFVGCHENFRIIRYETNDTIYFSPGKTNEIQEDDLIF